MENQNSCCPCFYSEPKEEIMKRVSNIELRVSALEQKGFLGQVYTPVGLRRQLSLQHPDNCIMREQQTPIHKKK